MSRVGKIARLPEQIREQINRRLQDGENGREILTWVNTSQEAKALLAQEFEGREINDSNLTAWRQGGFRDWQARQSALAEARRVMSEGRELSETGDKALADCLVQEFKEWNPEKHLYGKIELLTFSNTLKVEIFSKLRMAFEKRSVRVPISRLVREDLHSLNRVTTASGGVTYRAPHSTDGHADRCTALALALRAGQGQEDGVSLEFFLRLNNELNQIAAARRNRWAFP